MQLRMKQHPLSEAEITHLLNNEHVGHLATSGADGYPYTTPIHFVFINNCLYFHGLAKGEKLSNITNNCKVCFEVAVMEKILHDTVACDTNTQYKSVIIRGNATIVADTPKKIAVLDAVVGKYTPQHKGTTFPDAALKMTAVVEIAITSCTGKYYTN